MVSTFQALCAQEIKRLDGMVAQYLGDGVLAYFGYPVAHEDDAERAVRASLAIREAVKQALPAPGVRLQSRIGIASGVVVIGDLVREGVTQANAAIGETTNLAARLQSVAEPDTIVIAPETHRLVGALFAYHDLGAAALKGFPGDVRMWSVLGPSDVASRFEARYTGIRSELFGRDEELDLLERRWHSAKRGDGRVVHVAGEAGIGKSRLTRAFQQKLTVEPHLEMVFHCSPYHRDSALYPVVSQLTRVAGIHAADSAQTKLDKLEALLAMSGRVAGQDLALFANLLGISSQDRTALPQLDPQKLRQRTLDAMLDQLRGLCARRPVLMVFEDLHWVDPTTLELLTRLVEAAKTAPLMVLATARPEFSPPWPNDRHVSTLLLTRLGRSEVQGLVDAVTGRKVLPREVLEQIVQRTDGVPLFVEELTKTIIESGLLREAGDGYELTAPLPPLSIPSTLHASLMARLDRLASVKDVAQIGAAIGREFSYETIAAVAAMPEAEVRDALEQLTRAELVFQRGTPPHATYVFKHALVQDAAYSSLVRSRRQQLHARIAQVIEQQLPHLAAQEPATLAHHFTEAGMVERAIPLWAAAGSISVARSANVEAVSQFRQALGLLGQVAADPGRDQREVDLRNQYGLPLIATRGYASDEVEQNYTIATELAQRLGDANAEFASVRSLWNCVYDRAALERSQALADRLVLLADAAASNEKRCLAQRALGSTLMLRAEFASARRAFDRCLETGQGIPVQNWLREYGEAPILIARQYNGWIAAIEGRPDEARADLEGAVLDAQQLKHPLTLAFARAIFAIVLHVRGDHADCRDLAAENYALSQDQGFAFWSAQSEIFQGLSICHIEESPAGLDLAERGLRNWSSTGAELHVPTWSCFIAAAALRLGRHERAAELVSRALELAGARSETFALAELERISAALLRAGGRHSEARDKLERARAIAGAQGARLFEVRAAMDLAECLIAAGETVRARLVLDEVGPVGDGHPALPDLQQAAGLRAQLR